MSSKWIKSTKVLLILIIILSLFLRSYDVVNRFGYAADGDLFSWIVKDIVVNKHLRLVGQQTSTEGIYIGPLFYYLLIPFYLLNGIDPVGAIILAITLGVLTTWSFYFVFKKLFNEKIGLIAAFLQGVLLARVAHDRWIVPTITTSLWEIWYFYSLGLLLRGDFAVLPLVGLLIGLVWHVSLSLLPILILIPVAIILSKKIPSLKELTMGLAVLVISSLPLILFEIKHQFIQTKSLFSSFSGNLGDSRGILDKFLQVFDQAMSSLNLLFFYPHQTFSITQNLLFLLGIIGICLLLVKKKVLSFNLAMLFLIWFISMVGFFTLSSKLISEYYFDNLSMVFMAILVIILGFIYQSTKSGKIVILVLLGFVVLKSFSYIINIKEYNNMGYNERKSVARFISDDSRKRGFPCVSVSYLTKEGEDVGFRYFFYLNNLHVNQSKSGSPNYTIVIPTSLSPDAIKVYYGAIGVILPEGNFDQKQINYSCSGANSNLTDPMVNYVQ